jgi:hypothetical protein
MPTSHVVSSVITLIVPPANTVLWPGFRLDVVAASVAPAGMAAVAPEKSTYTLPPGCVLNAAIQVAWLEGTVMLVALPFVRVALYFIDASSGA